MLYLFVGQVRSGKTCSVVNEVKKFFDEGYTIYSNTKLSFNYRPLTRKMILEWEKNEIDMPPKTVFLISELGAWFDSRNSQNSNNKCFSYFINQLGKFTDDKSKGLTIVSDTQFFSNIDIRGRRVCKYIIECKKVNEVVGEYIEVVRKWKINNNLVLKTFKIEKVRFTKEDFNLYDTQARVVSEIN